MIYQKKLSTGEFSVLYKSTNLDNIMLICPGIGYSKVGPYFLLSNIAQSLYRSKKNVMIFDYFGLGDSDGDYISLSYQRIVKSSQNVLLYLREIGYRRIVLIGLGIGNLVCNELCMEPDVSGMCLIDYTPTAFSSTQMMKIRNMVGLVSKTYTHPVPEGKFDYKKDILYNYKKCKYPVYCIDSKVLGEISKLFNILNPDNWNDEVELAKVWEQIGSKVVEWVLQNEVENPKPIKNSSLRVTENNRSNVGMEELIEIDGLQGIFYKASTFAIGESRTCVIYEPGLGGERVDHMRVGVLAARKLSENGFFFLRYDFYGCGVSEGEFYKFRWSDKFYKLQAIMEYLKIKYDIRNFIILSYSEGAKTAIRACKQCDAVKAAIMWSPVLINGFINYQGLQEEDRKKIELPKFIKDKKRGIVLPTQAYYLGLNYFIDQKENQLYENLIENDKPIKVLYGERDVLFERKVYLSKNIKVECEALDTEHLFDYKNTYIAIDKSLDFLKKVFHDKGEDKNV